MTLPLRRAWLALIAMVCAAALAQWMVPTHKLADTRGGNNSLEAAVPLKFADWRVDADTFRGVVNPQQAEVLSKLYSQLVTRTYVNSQGQRIMLSIAYGVDQRDGMQVHKPEICYPAQGFGVISNRDGILQTNKGPMPVRRLETALGNQRPEPVTYWTTVGNEVTPLGMQKKLMEMRYGLQGVVPDGLLFRVSSIGADSAAQFALHERFVLDLLPQLTAPSRLLVAGQY